MSNNEEIEAIETAYCDAYKNECLKFSSQLFAHGTSEEEILKDYTDGAAGFSVSFYAPENDGTHSDKGIDHVAVGMNQIDFQCMEFAGEI